MQKPATREGADSCVSIFDLAYSGRECQVFLHGIRAYLVLVTMNAGLAIESRALAPALAQRLGPAAPLVTLDRADHSQRFPGTSFLNLQTHVCAIPTDGCRQILMHAQNQLDKQSRK